MMGRQGGANSVEAGYLSLQQDWRDRPGKLLPDGTPEDPDYTGCFTAYDVKYLARTPAGRRAGWTWKLGYTGTEERESNRDALTAGDPKAFSRLRQQSKGPTAEARYDRALGSRDALVAGVGYFGEDWKLSGRVGQPQPPGSVPPVTWGRFSDEADRDAVTLYLWRQWQPGDRLYALLGGRMATRRGMKPVVRPEGYLRQGLGRQGTVILLTRAVLADDVTELSPVQDWGLRDWLSPLDLALGGYSQSNELQYEWLPSSGALVRLSLFRRDLKNYLVDLQDPQWSAGAAAVVLASGTLTGGEIEAEQWLTRSLSAGLWARFTESKNQETGDRDIPYQPTMTGYLRADYLAENGMRVGVVWLHVGKRYADLANTTRLGGYSVLNLRADWQRNLHTDWFITVDNLLNEDYAYWQDYPSPGRKARVGINYRW
jgi:outer membrane receptor protein involved in Fe transport